MGDGVFPRLVWVNMTNLYRVHPKVDSDYFLY